MLRQAGFTAFSIQGMEYISSGDVATDLASIWMLFAEKDIREKAIAS